MAALTLNAGTGEAADVNLAAGTVLIANADSTLGAQVGTLFPNPVSIEIQGSGSLGLVSPATTAAATRTYTVNPFVNSNLLAVPSTIIAVPIVEGDAAAAAMNLNKSGRGTLMLRAASAHGGSTTINSQSRYVWRLMSARASSINSRAL